MVERTEEPNQLPSDDGIEAAATLREPVRRTLFELVTRSATPVDRDEAAAAAGIGRPLAAFHLDRLVRAGLLEVEYHRRSGRTGPGAGRPAKFYRPKPGLEIEVSVPSRRYRLAAEIFADGLERADDAVLGDVQAAARDRGIAIGATAASATSSLSAATGAPATTSGRSRLRSVLEASGFAPADDGDEIRLGNCPFDPIAAGHRDLTCPMNLALLDGVLEGIGETGYAAVAAPVEGSCCVRFVPS